MFVENRMSRLIALFLLFCMCIEQLRSRNVVVDIDDPENWLTCSTRRALVVEQRALQRRPNGFSDAQFTTSPALWNDQPVTLIKSHSEAYAFAEDDIDVLICRLLVATAPARASRARSCSTCKRWPTCRVITDS